MRDVETASSVLRGVPYAGGGGDMDIYRKRNTLTYHYRATNCPYIQTRREALPCLI